MRERERKEKHTHIAGSMSTAVLGTFRNRTIWTRKWERTLAFGIHVASVENDHKRISQNYHSLLIGNEEARDNASNNHSHSHNLEPSMIGAVLGADWCSTILPIPSRITFAHSIRLIAHSMTRTLSWTKSNRAILLQPPIQYLNQSINQLNQSINQSNK